MQISVSSKNLLNYTENENSSVQQSTIQFIWIHIDKYDKDILKFNHFWAQF